MKKIYLKKGREKLPFNHHPWVFSGAVQRSEKNIQAGEVVEVLSHDNRFIAKAHYNPSSKIVVRLLEWDRDASIDLDWYRSKIKDAIALREVAIDSKSDVYRLIYSESDLLPGLIVDRFGEFLVLQAMTQGFDGIKSQIATLLMEELPGIKGVYEKSTGDGRRMEGLEESTGLLSGMEPEGRITVRENGLEFLIDLKGQKTGFYADQRDNRLKAARYAEGKEVLDVCTYTGGFSLYALSAGAKNSTLCDISKDALEVASENLKRNGFENFETREADSFQLLRNMRKEAELYDMIVLDPPKLVPSRRHLEKGSRAYKDLNMNAMHLLKPGGILVTFSCSGNMPLEKFREAVAYAAKDAGREVQILEHLHQGADHPIRSSVPETEYLKGLILRVL